MEAEAFEQTLNEFESQLVGYSFSFLGDLEAARDAVQDTFLRLWKQKTPPTSVKAWLYTTCRNRSIDLLRKEKHTTNLGAEQVVQVQATTPTPDQEAEGRDEHAMVIECLRHLSTNQQEVIRLRFEAGMSYRNISQVTGLSEGNVGFLLHNALKNLRKMMLDIRQEHTAIA